MPEKGASLGWILGRKPMVHWWLRIVMMGVFLAILIVWTIDGGLNVSTFQKDLVIVKLNSSGDLSNSLEQDSTFNNLSIEKIDFNLTQRSLANNHQNLEPDPSSVAPAQTHENLEFDPSSEAPENTKENLEPNPPVSENPSSAPRILPWVSAEFGVNFSTNLLAKWLRPGGETCMDSKTVDIRVPVLDGNDNSIELAVSDIHEFVFEALDDSGNPHCLGGDYFETDLNGEKWKSRPPVKDLGNGTYTVSLQVHPQFAGDYNLTIILLFRHYDGLKFSPARFVFDKVLRVIPIKFVKSASKLPDIRQCEESDYGKDVWSGRWTRHARNDSCPISNDGRYRCQERHFPCQHPWCDGPLGVLESNGWIYSAHCSFKLFSSRDAWNCLSNRWIFWWGDSNHCDTLRNILYFVLGVTDFPVVPRRFDMNITNPRNPSQTVRFTSIFNGHFNETLNYYGLNSLSDQGYRELLKGYFSGSVVPDTIIMNSGLHDGIFWSSIRHFIKGADYAAAFWSEVLEGVRKRGVTPPEVIYRTTVATGGYARALAFNPQKMEHFNAVVLDKLRQYGVLGRVIDDFDMTFPWHFDNRCSDGVHYGRAPLKAKWRDGEIGHQYFVDLMLGHVLLNVLCVRQVS